MIDLLFQFLKRLVRALKKSKTLIVYFKVVFGQAFGWVKRGRFICALNYLWARIFSIEEGLALPSFLYIHNPDLAPLPRRIELEITNKCCLRCLKCEHTYWDIKEEHMSYDHFKKVVDQFPGLRAISVTGIGHGFENREYLKMLRYLKNKSLFVQFFDPLFLPNEKTLEEVVKIGVDWIWMSIDGATKETYEKLQAGSNFEKVISNVKHIMNLKKRMKVSFPELHFQFIVTKYNVDEMPKFVELVHSLVNGGQKLTEIQFIKLIPFKENLYLVPEVSEQVVKKTEELVKKLGGLSVKYIHFDKKCPPICECVAWTVPFITVDGTVYPCCTLTEGNIRHLVKEYCFGNVFEKDFKDIWNSEQFKTFRHDIHNGKVPLLCYKFRPCTLYNLSGPKVREEGKE